VKTREDVENLKANWISDPCYNLETVEGFEEYSNELRRFQTMMESKWKNEYNDMIKSLSEKYECSFKLAEYIYNLEIKLQKIQNRIGFY
jgi:ribosomal protein L6P/L9E